MKCACASALAALVIAGGLFVSCARTGVAFSAPTLAGVEEMSPGQIGRLDPILVRFTAPIRESSRLAGAAAFTPPARGSWTLLDDRTAQFTPDRPWRKAGFVLSVDTGVLGGTEPGKRGFSVSFAVKPATVEVVPDGLYADSGDSFTFSGILVTDIPVGADAARKMVSARLGAKGRRAKLETVWEDEGPATARRFTVRGISRAKEDRYLTLSWNGRTAGSKDAGEKSWLVPAASEFRVLEIAADDPSVVRVRFSDPLDRSQDLRGLVQAGDLVNVRYTVDSNVLSLYTADGWKADTGITVHTGIRSSTGKTLAVQAAAQISRDWEIPEVRFAGEGVILPTTSGVIVPVETKNLRGLIVEAYRIYGDNILQFLQVNELDGSNELLRVGDPVWSSSFDFNWDDGMKNRWVPRGLDLSALVKQNPSGMIQLRVTFRNRHVLYECPADHQDFSALPMPADGIPLDRKESSSEQSYWSYFEGMDWKTRQTYWRYRNDPCHPAFYLYNYHDEIVQRKNVLVSDLGIMAKLDSDGAYHVTVADIGTAQPAAGVGVSIYTYSRQMAASGKTDANGFFTAKPAGDASFITATRGGQTSYLSLGAGAALGVSHFPVDGVKPEKGVKGFIYGERGVWRPGDDIHLVFVMQDLAKRLPANFPVTFELQDPKGRIAQTAVYSNAVGGFYRIDTKTGADDPTGPWIARVKAGGQVWSKTLRVETIVPNRLSISLKTRDPILRAEGNQCTLSAAWLHGAAAPGLKADVSAIFFPGSTTFDGYADYSFVNPERDVESSRHTVWEGSLDRNSAANFSLDLNAGDNLPGKLRAQLVTRVFEPSGAFSIEQANFDYSPYERYVGLKLPKGDAMRGMLLTDTKHRADIAVLDAAGKPVPGRVPVSVSVYQLQWRWWWEKDALTDASYAEGRSTRLVASGRTTAQNGKASWEFEVKHPEWGRYLVVATDETGGHSAAKIVYIDWPGWAGRAQEGGTGSAAMLTLLQDKPSYRAGETAGVTFSSGSGGRALVTVEKDGAVLWQKWLETADGTTVCKVPLTAQMAPNAYVHISLLQKHLQTANSLPIRLYGVLPLMVEDPATRLAPQISAPAKYEPGKRASLTVSETSGRPMTCTVAVVDEGLLGLTRFTVPDPWNEFYKKEASRLSSWDLYRYVMSAYGGKLETLLSIGGSEDILNKGDKKADRFKPVVRFFGPFELGANGTKDISFEMPQYVGAVRVMVVAGKDGAYGSAEKSVPVKSELMVLPTLPRTLGVNETIEIPVTLFNGTGSAQTVSLGLAAKGALEATLSKQVTVPALSDATASFRVTTDRAGKASIRVSGSVAATGAKNESVTEIDILSRGSPIATTAAFTVSPGQAWKGDVPSPGERGTRTMTVELSTLPVIDIQSRLRYLITYPHGCIEQITSGGFPQLFLADLIDTGGEERETIKANVRSVIERYPGYQTASGGFAYWPGNGEANYWGSNYAGHFMTEARKAGYEVPDSVFKPWLAFQQQAARSWQASDHNDSSVQAYRLYTLALSGHPDLGAMNRLSTDTRLEGTGRWLLAASYALAGHGQAARDLTKGLALWPDRYRETGYTWGSDSRDAALILHSLNVMTDARAAGMVPALAERMGSDGWYSTQETVWMLMALAPHYRQTVRQNAAWTVSLNGTKTSGELGRATRVLALPAAETGAQALGVSNTGGKTLYVKAVTRGIVPAGQERPVEEGLGLAVQYLDANGATINPEYLKLGDSFTVRVTVRNGTADRADNVALSLPVPTCWEFANDRVGAPDEGGPETAGGEEGRPGGANGRGGTNAPLFDYQDIKDTHIYTYFSLNGNETKLFEFSATVAYSGNYYIPAIRAEAMYSPEYQAVLPGRAVAMIQETVPPAARNTPR